MKRQHPIAILRYVSKNFWLLLIPLLRGLLALKFDFYNWLSGAYLDILVVLTIFGAAFFRWRNITFRIGSKDILVKSGFFVRERFRIPLAAVTAVSMKKAFFLRPIKAVTVLLDTDSSAAVNKPEDPDLKLVIKEKDIDELLKYYENNMKDELASYKSNRRRMLFFSLAFSSALTGLIYFGTFLIQEGRLVGNELEERLLGAVSDVTHALEKVINGITPVTVGIIIVLGAGWLYSFISNYLRHINFELKKSGGCIRIKSGFFSRWLCFINGKKINYADLRQNLLMKLCRVMSVNVSCSGYGKRKDEIPVFVPVAEKKNVTEVMKKFLPEFSAEGGIGCGVERGYIMKFLGPPTALIFSIMLAFLAAVMIFPDWYSVALFAAIMGEIEALHLMLVNLAAFLSNGVEVCGSCVVVRYCRAFEFHNVIAPLDKISEIRISQNFLQRLNGSCNFILYTRGERAARHRVRGLRLSEAERAAELLGYSVG